MRNRVAHSVRLAFLLLSLQMLGGCGGPTSLSGGSVPLGAAVRGSVVRADNTSLPVGQANVTLSTAGSVLGQPVGPGGQFEFKNLRSGIYTCTVQVPPTSDLRNDFEWSFEVAPKNVVRIIAALPPKSFDPGIVDRVELAPSGLSVKVGDTARFMTEIFDVFGNRVVMGAALMLAGNVGSLDATGQFVATSPGSGQVQARLGGATALATVEVTP
jgi:hypothetical protein